MLALTYTKAHNLSKLHDELIAAGLSPQRIEGTGTALRLEYPDGTPSAPIDAAVTAHTNPAAVTVFEPQIITRTLRTTNATATPFPTIPVPLNAITTAAVRVLAWNPATDATRLWDFRLSAKRAAGNAALIGAVLQPTASQGDAGAPAAGAVVVAITGQNLVVTVAGQAATALTWLCEIDARVRRPSGF